MFREPEAASPAISFGGNYLAAPNIGIQGSRGASAIPLLATLIAWGKKGLSDRIDHGMSMATMLAAKLNKEGHFSLWSEPTTGITVFRPRKIDTEEFYQRLPEGMFPTCFLEGEQWLRSVAANPLADIDEIFATIQKAAE